MSSGLESKARREHLFLDDVPLTEVRKGDYIRGVAGSRMLVLAIGKNLLRAAYFEGENILVSEWELGNYTKFQWSPIQVRTLKPGRNWQYGYFYKILKDAEDDKIEGENI